jgi:hypothetical protein
MLCYFRYFRHAEEAEGRPKAEASSIEEAKSSGI